jgi:hypothetical protein
MYYLKITIDLGPAQTEVIAGFTEDMNSKGYGLLGQHGFFDHFKVQFDLPSKIFGSKLRIRPKSHYHPRLLAAARTHRSSINHDLAHYPRTVL